MGGHFSIPAPPPRVTEAKYPVIPARVNANLSTSSAQQCNGCAIAVDTRVTTASVTLTRDYGNVSAVECKQYQIDKEAVSKKQMSFGDFLNGLKTGKYTRPVSEVEGGAQFCEQVTVDEEMMEKLKTYQDFIDNEAKLAGVRIRKVTGGGSFSSGTKAKIKLSLPIRSQYVSEIKTVDGKPVPQVKPITIRSMTLYHPSPIRVENVQHDAVLSLNDPSDEVNGEDTVILIPLKGSNLGSASESFFNRIVTHTIGLAQPNTATGLFDKVDVPTGSDWSLASLFWLGEPDGDGFAKIEDSYYSWDGLPTFDRAKTGTTYFDENFRRVFKWNAPAAITYGWNKSDSSVRYFMVGSPVNISMTDLSILTRNLPPTVPEEAIHRIPDSSIKPPPRGPNQPMPPGWPGTPIVYKAAEGKAIAGSCCGGRERTEPVEEGPKDLPSFGTESFTNAGSITPNSIVTIVFGFITVIFMMIGAAVALYFIHRDYDYKLRSASNTVGEVVGRWVAKIAGPIKEARAMISSARSGAGGLVDLKQGGIGGLAGKLGGPAGLADTLGPQSLDVTKFKQSLGSTQPQVQNLLGSAGSLLKGVKR